MAGNLRDKYCIVGIGETEFTRNAGCTTQELATRAIRRAMEDAGLDSTEVDGIMGYGPMSRSIRTALTGPEGSQPIASDLGIRPNFHMDMDGGGSSTEAMVGLAMGAIEVGMCHTVIIYRSMLGYSGQRRGGTGVMGSAPFSGGALLDRSYGIASPAQRFAPVYMRYMMESGTTSSQVAHVKVACSKAASNNPRALYKNRVTVEDVLNSRWITKPLHMLDCCIEDDAAAAIIVTSAERAKNLKQKPVYIMGVAGRVCKSFPHYYVGHGNVTKIAGEIGKDIVFNMAGIGPDDVDVTGAYDCFTFAATMQLEGYGFCKKGEGGEYVSSGIIELGGKRPNNTSGGQLCEGYLQGLTLVIENVRQLRGQADDYCSDWREGKHTYDYSEGHCRQVKDAEIAMNMGWESPGCNSALIMRR